MVGRFHKDWSSKLDNALWAYHTVYKTPIGMSPYWLIYGTTCHLLVEVHHKAYLAISRMKLDLGKARATRLMQLNELDELYLVAYNKVVLYKELTNIGKVPKSFCTFLDCVSSKEN